MTQGRVPHSEAQNSARPDSRFAKYQVYRDVAVEPPLESLTFDLKSAEKEMTLGLIWLLGGSGHKAREYFLT